jgi:hypothetical protein
MYTCLCGCRRSSIQIPAFLETAVVIVDDGELVSANAVAS